MIGLGKIGGHAAGDRHFRSKLGKAKAAEYADYAADYPTHKRHTHGHVYALKYVAAKIIDTGAYGHAGHKADTWKTRQVLSCGVFRCCFPYDTS